MLRPHMTHQTRPGLSSLHWLDDIVAGSMASHLLCMQPQPGTGLAALNVLLSTWPNEPL